MSLIVELINEELEARRWTEDDLKARCGSDDPVDLMAIELLMADTACLLDRRTAELLEQALGPSAQFWVNLSKR
jgi:plasmid maintenance system antidote protein VapI